LKIARLRRAVGDDVPFVSVVLVTASGFCYSVAAPGHWLRGVALIAAGLITASVLRALLPNGKAGLLVVRGRLFDTLCYLGLGLAVLGFGVLVPQ
jgi:hypothetical protein